MKKIILFALLLGTFSSFAQIVVTAEVRPRFEYRNGFKALRPENDFTAASFIEQRTRLYLNYKREKMELHIAAQDIRMWGNHNQIYKTDNMNMTNIYEGWALYNFTGKWWFKVGRQALDYDNARFLGNLDWAQQGRSHDAFLFRWQDTDKGWITDIGFAINNSGNEPAYLQNAYYALNNYKNMQFAHITKKFDNSKWGLVIQNDGRSGLVDSSAVLYRQTFGLTGDGNLTKGLKLHGEFYMQTGKNAANINVNTMMASLYLTIKTKVTPITIGGDYLSGTENGASEDKSFNPLYGTNHKFYGYMDYFYVGNTHGQQGRVTGLIDGFLKTKFKFNDKHALAADFHYFMSPTAIYQYGPGGVLLDLNNEASSGLGTEIDLVYKITVSKDVNFMFGYSHMFATESMELIKTHMYGGNGSSNSTNNWGWIMLTFKPQLLNK